MQHVSHAVIDGLYAVTKIVYPPFTKVYHEEGDRRAWGEFFRRYASVGARDQLPVSSQEYEQQ